MNPSLVVLALGGLAAFLFLKKSRGVPPTGPAHAVVTSSPQSAPPVNPLAGFMAGAEPYMVETVQRGVGAHFAGKWAADMAEALNKVTGPAVPPKS